MNQTKYAMYEFIAFHTVLAAVILSALYFTSNTAEVQFLKECKEICTPRGISHARFVRGGERLCQCAENTNAPPSP